MTGVREHSQQNLKFECEEYIHQGLGSFFETEGAEKQFCLAPRPEWAEGDTFDDFC